MTTINAIFRVPVFAGGILSHYKEQIEPIKGHQVGDWLVWRSKQWGKLVYTIFQCSTGLAVPVQFATSNKATATALATALSKTATRDEALQVLRAAV